MIVITQSGIITSLDWWSQLKVLGDALVLQGVPDDEPVNVLTVATLGSEAEAQVLFTVINGRIHLGARLFDVRDWTASVDDGGATVGEGA